MKQEQIDYKDIIALGFKEEDGHDQVFFNKYGYEYTIVTKKLTKKIHLDWAKETRLCQMIRIDSPKKCNVKARVPIPNLTTLRGLIKFFTDK